MQVGLDGRPVPRVPTDGWSRGELDRLGEPVRGHHLTSAELCSRLRAHGYEVYESATAAGRAESEDGAVDR